MAWTTPKTWSSEPLTSADLNTYIRDNQSHLKTILDNNEQYTANEEDDYSTSSTEFVDVDAVNFSHTITTNGGAVLVGFTGAGSAGGSGTGDKIHFTIDVDGSPFAGDDGIYMVDTNDHKHGVGFVVLVTGLSATSHVFKLQWKMANSGTGRLYASSDTSYSDIHPQFWVQEI